MPPATRRQRRLEEVSRTTALPDVTDHQLAAPAPPSPPRSPVDAFWLDRSLFDDDDDENEHRTSAPTPAPHQHTFPPLTHGLNSLGQQAHAPASGPSSPPSPLPQTPSTPEEGFVLVPAKRTSAALPATRSHKLLRLFSVSPEPGGSSVCVPQTSRRVLTSRLAPRRPRFSRQTPKAQARWRTRRKLAERRDGSAAPHPHR